MSRLDPTWAELADSARRLAEDAAKAEQEADLLILDGTRAGMRQDGSL